MKKLLVALSFLLAPVAFAEAATFTLYNYTDKPLVVHYPAPSGSTTPGHDVNLPAASMQNGVWTLGQFSDVLDGNYQSDGLGPQQGLFGRTYTPPNISVDGWDINTQQKTVGFGNTVLNYGVNCPVTFFAPPAGDCSAAITPAVTDIAAKVYTNTLTLQQNIAAFQSQLNDKMNALQRAQDDYLKNLDVKVNDIVVKSDAVQTSVNNYLTTTSGNQTNLVHAVSTAMQSARDAAALDTKDYGVNNFYPSMTKQSADGKYLVYPAQSFTLSGGCVLNAAPNNYLTVAQDANQEKNATQLLTAMVLGRRVEITQHQKDLETTDCGVIDSVKILDK